MSLRRRAALSAGATCALAAALAAGVAAPAAGAGLHPRLGRTFVATRVSGVVTVGVPSTKKPAAAATKFFKLKGSRLLPVGATVDTSKGRVRLVLAANGRGATQKAEAYNGRFKVLQARTKAPVAELRLDGGDFSVCPATTSTARQAQSSTKRIRRLWVSGKGRFRTRGRYASATVRGTKWLTEDRCEGTFVFVAEGSVSVLDFRTGTKTVVKAQGSILVSPSGTTQGGTGPTPPPTPPTITDPQGDTGACYSGCPSVPQDLSAVTVSLGGGQITYKIEEYGDIQATYEPTVEIYTSSTTVGAPDYVVSTHGVFALTGPSAGAMTGVATASRPDSRTIVYSFADSSIGSPASYRWRVITRAPCDVLDKAPDTDLATQSPGSSPGLPLPSPLRVPGLWAQPQSSVAC